MNTLQEFLDYLAEQFGEAESYLWLEDGAIRSQTFRGLREDAQRTAAHLRAHYGTARKIALIGDMSYPWICAYYGIMTSGNVTVPLDTKLSAPELAERLRFADVDLVFLSQKYEGVREALSAACPQVERFLALEECPFGDAPCAPWVRLDPDALSSLMFTSGTSGDTLKAAMISQRAILADVTGPVPLCVPGDRLLSLLPIHHCFEIFVGQMKYLYLGGAICVNDSMANLIPNLSRFGITIVVAVPALANLLSAFIARGLQTHTMDEVRAMLGGKLRRITIGGASASREVIETLKRAGITVFVGYGLTESTGGCLANCDASIRPLEAGAPYVEGMEMKLEDGELCLRGPMVMQGYYKAPELTRQVLVDGWLHTNDLAEITDEGYVIIHGRKDNMIKTSNGEKIYPENWEARLHNLPAVAAAMVAQVEDHLCALVLLREDSPEQRDTVRQAVDRVNASLPGYEKILDLRFREKPFPMTTSLKIKRGEVLRELEEAGQTRRAAAPPENDAQRWILAQVREVLSRPGTIGVDDNLYALGLDSLSTIGLAVLLDCDAETIYACKTIRALEKALSGALEPSRAEKAADINRFLSVKPSAPAGLGQRVLLTGASGYLGAHLLRELLNQGHQVTCLVRSPERLRRALSFYGFPGLHCGVLTGDITQPRLGLSAEGYEALCGQVDAVVHAAALVSHVGSEEASRRVNVEGTREVLRFCRRSGASLFHISSYAVSGFHTHTPLTEEVLDIGQDIGLNPYIKTKYQAEEQVLLARGEGVASTILRVGNLSPRRADGVFQRNPEESGMAAQLRAVRALGVYPRSMGAVPYDDTPVDLAARAIVLLSERFGAGSVWHIINPSVHTLGQITGARAVDDADFARQLSERLGERDIAILSVYYRMKRNGFNVNFDARHTQAALKELGFSWERER